MLKNLADDLKDFVRKCLTTDERKRITLREIAAHPFYSRIITDANPVLLRKITSTN
jgi:serine/threonine protein kinase